MCNPDRWLEYLEDRLAEAEFGDDGEAAAIREAEDADRWHDEQKDRDMTAEHDARWDAERLAAEEAAWREDGWR